MKKIKYILSNHAKYHHLEVAKSLYKKDQLLKVISGYPWFKLKKEKIPKKFIDCLGLYNIINYFIRESKYSSVRHLESKIKYMNAHSIDKRCLKYIDQADVLIALSGAGLLSGRKMVNEKKIYVCERSSAHYLFTKELLSDEYRSLNLNSELSRLMSIGFRDWMIERELQEYESANYILVPSQFAAKTFKKYNFTKTIVAEFGINLEKFHQIKEIKKNNEYFDILFIGQLCVRKGLHYLIEAFHQFKHVNKRLHIIGSQTMDREFFINKLKDEKIFYHGTVEHHKLKYFINKSDVFVLPSLEEGFATVVLQALACGCPVIVSENTGAEDYVRKNKCGFVVPIRNSRSISEKLELLSDNNNLKLELANNALKASKQNTWDDYVQKLNNFFSNII